MNVEILALCAGLVAGAAFVVVGILASADAEGRGENWIAGGVLGAIVFLICAVSLICIAIGRFFHP